MAGPHLHLIPNPSPGDGAEERNLFGRLWRLGSALVQGDPRPRAARVVRRRGRHCRLCDCARARETSRRINSTSLLRSMMTNDDQMNKTTSNSCDRADGPARSVPRL